MLQLVASRHETGSEKNPGVYQSVYETMPALRIRHCAYMQLGRVKKMFRVWVKKKREEEGLFIFYFQYLKKKGRGPFLFNDCPNHFCKVFS